LDSMLSSCLLGCPKLCFQWSLSFRMYRIANLHRIFPDCICSYDGFMVENLRMHRIIIASSLHHNCIIIEFVLGILETSGCIESCTFQNFVEP
jgi:hypothetical protein